MEKETIVLRICSRYYIHSDVTCSHLRITHYCVTRVSLFVSIWYNVGQTLAAFFMNQCIYRKTNLCSNKTMLTKMTSMFPVRPLWTTTYKGMIYGVSRAKLDDWRMNNMSSLELTLITNHQNDAKYLKFSFHDSK